MKVEIRNECVCPEEKKYPYIGTFPSDGTVVLFEKPDTGTVLKKGNGWSTHDIGHYSTTWIESRVVKTTGEVVLKND